METKIIYTETGKKAIDDYLEKQKKQLEDKIQENKYVFGDEEIEITAADVKSYIQDDFFDKKRLERKKRLMSILELYILLGIIMTIIGSFYPIIIEMYESNPFQFIFVIMGLLFTLSACISWFYLYKKNKSKK